MSHLKERKEKNCLNCRIHVKGRFCHRCGQENIEPKETVWHLITHFFQDITHFDGKFFSSLKYLLTKPGFLSTQYMIGRRASYINPIRMYVFTSAIFFLIFFSVFKIDRKSISNTAMNGKTFAQISAMDSLAFDAFTKDVNKDDGKGELPMGRAEFKKYFDSVTSRAGIHFTPGKYKTKADYDSVLQSGKKKHNWLERQFIYKNIEVNEKYKNNPDEITAAFGNILIHSLPQMLFVLLPIFALMLKLLYIRRKNYYYVNHGIFSLHFYIFSFIIMLGIFGLGEINDRLDWGAITFIEVLMSFGIFFYLYKAMRNFYQQRRAKTALKFILLCLMLFITFLLLFTFLVLFSLFKL